MLPNDMESIKDFGSFQKLILKSGGQIVVIVG